MASIGHIAVGMAAARAEFCSRAGPRASTRPVATTASSIVAMASIELLLFAPLFLYALWPRARRASRTEPA